MLELFI